MSPRIILAQPSLFFSLRNPYLAIILLFMTLISCGFSKQVVSGRPKWPVAQDSLDIFSQISLIDGVVLSKYLKRKEEEALWSHKEQSIRMNGVP